jgi:predicted dehydrogenase
VNKVTVGMIGTGWAGTRHAEAYNKVYGRDMELRAVCSLDPQIREFARKYGFRDVYDDYRQLLRDPEINVIDIITPPHTHLNLIGQAVLAGKDVICEKPVTGYFGRGDDPEPVGLVSKTRMFNAVMDDLQRLRGILEGSGKKFFYAENWIYSPGILRAAELLKAKQMKSLVINAVIAHNGSHADHAIHWKYNGGGALIRQGTHPIATAVFLKRQEAEGRGEPFGIQSVLCDSAAIVSGIPEKDRKFIDARPVDVEDWAQVLITFADGTKANITASDLVVGGIRNQLEIIGSEGTLQCNMTPNNLLNVYFADETGIENMHIMEKNDHNFGFQNALVAEGVIRGFVGEIQDFIECVASEKDPLSGWEIAFDTLLVIYAAYASAESGKTVDVSSWYKPEFGKEGDLL